ncbi:methyltransferase domain-containing protein [Paenibacillus sp. TAB 01]|uniref:methyltransferase domain-containing protein n=1 Tax=Paenibacillus sp. TAB 01 TaxID=3368988 RepID=UPI0037519C02
MIKLVIFGTAINATLLFETGGFNKDVKIVASIDNSPSRIGKEYYGIIIKQPEEIVNIDFDYVLITSRTNYVEMANQLLLYKIPVNKIIISYEEGHINFFGKMLGGNRTAVLTRPSTYRTETKYGNAEIVHDLVNDTIITQIPVELLRVNSELRHSNGDSVLAASDEFLENNPIDYQIYRSPYYPELFDYLSGASENYPSAYLKLFKATSDSQAEKVLMMRKEFYDKQMSILQQGFSYYKEHTQPITVKYDKNRGFFSVIDGLHRATFLYSKGVRHIYAMMSLNDYNAYTNKSNISPLIELLGDFKINDIYTSILHPTFYRYSTLRDIVFPTRVELAFKALRGINLRGKKLIDIGCNNGYNARMFAREGLKVTAIEMDKNIYELAKAISVLENTNVNYVYGKFEDIEATESYDIALLMTVLYWYLETPEILESFFERLNSMVSEMIIWESGDKPELEKELIIRNTKFKKYQKLSITTGTGKLREFGIFRI